MPGLLGKKIGMTSVFSADGKNVPCTVMESSRSGARIVKAKVPLAEMFGYVTALRTITSGRATSSMTYDHHAQVSSSIAKAVLEEVKGRVDLV